MTSTEHPRNPAVTSELRDDTLVVRVAGDIDLSSIGAVERAVGEATAPHPDAPLVLDLGSTDFVDSSGVAFLLDLEHGRGARFALAAPSSPVRRVLELISVERLQVTASVDEAVARVTARG